MPRAHAQHLPDQAANEQSPTGIADRLHSLSTMTNNIQKARNQNARNQNSWPSDLWSSARREPRLVELNGIEPSTSCLQSRRSPS
jgi:hypothetical protein